jgi:hypothetical protein
MREIHDHADAVIEGEPRVIFETITDIERLPEWSGAIEQVIDRPAGLTTGATWTVEMHPARPVRWKSVSTLQELDAKGLRLSIAPSMPTGTPLTRCGTGRPEPITRVIPSCLRGAGLYG